MNVLRPEYKPPRPLPAPRATQNSLPRWANQSRATGIRCAPVPSSPPPPPHSRNPAVHRPVLPIRSHLDTIRLSPTRVYYPALYCPIEGIICIRDHNGPRVHFYRRLFDFPSGTPLLSPTGPNLCRPSIDFHDLCAGGWASTHPTANPSRPLPCYTRLE